MATEPWDGPIKHFVRCDRCEKAVNATEVGSAIFHAKDSGPARKTTLARCDVCGQAQLFVQESDEHADEWDEMVRVWPNPVRPLSNVVPEPLRAEHDEARRCFDARAYTATAVMARRTLEGACAEHGVREDTLAESLAELHGEGLLDPRLLEWARALRVVADDDGTHVDGKRVSRADAADALALSEAVLDHLYVLTARFNEFRRRRDSRPAPPVDQDAEQENGAVALAPASVGFE